MAFVTVDRRKLRNASLGGDSRATIIENMLRHPERLLSIVQIGITLVGAISAAVSGAGAEESITPILMSWFGLTEPVAEIISIGTVVIPLTILSVVVGELVPKSIALRYSMTIILTFSKALRLTEKMLGPIISPMESANKFVLRLLLPKKMENEVIAATEEISLSGLKKEHKQYIFNLIDLDAKTVQSTMKPWSEVDFILYESEQEIVLEQILSTGHTRLPVVANGEVCGFLHTKEFLNLFKGGVADNWVNFMRPPKFVKLEAKLFDVLKMMQKERVHILIVGDDSNPLGVLTLEDVIKEVIGDITDEDDDNTVNMFLGRNPLSNDQRFKFITKKR
jgi:putative hemolysin